jgi:excisionase family DNA binding protein
MYPIIERLDKIETLLEEKTKDKWLSLRQACDYTSLSFSTLRRNISGGRLKVSKVAGKLLFRKIWLDKWLKG